MHDIRFMVLPFLTGLITFKPQVWQKQVFARRNQTLAAMSICPPSCGRIYVSWVDNTDSFAAFRSTSPRVGKPLILIKTWLQASFLLQRQYFCTWNRLPLESDSLLSTTPASDVLQLTSDNQLTPHHHPPGECQHPRFGLNVDIIIIKLHND